jgi:hypothetical protein
MKVVHDLKNGALNHLFDVDEEFFDMLVHELHLFHFQMDASFH